MSDINHFQAIPKDLPTVAGWKSHPVKDNNDPLVALGAFSAYSKNKIVSQAIYYGETEHSPYHFDELEGALITPFVRKEIAEKLVIASELLPDNMYLLVLDAYRPLSVQKALYDDFHSQLVAKGLSFEEAEIEAQKFVSKPSNDPNKPSPHNTGGSVDLTIIQVDEETGQKIKELDSIISAYGNDIDMWPLVYAAEIKKMALLRNNGTELPMGTAFDEVCPATATAYFENNPHLSSEEENIRDNRRLLYNVMAKAGLTNYDEEWWHFDFGNQFDAIRTGKDAIYSTANFDDSCAKHETMMQQHHKGLAKLVSDQKNAPDMMGESVQETGKIVPMEIEKWESSDLVSRAKDLAKLISEQNDATAMIREFVQETGKIVQMEIGTWEGSALTSRAKRLTA